MGEKKIEPEMRMQIYISVVAHGWARHESQEIAERNARRHSGLRKGCKQITWIIESDNGQPFDATDVWVNQMGTLYWPADTTRTEVARYGETS